MRTYSLRQHVGAAVIDWPRFAFCMARPHGWIRFRNRKERLTIDRETGGARCEWQYTSDIHLCHVFPSTGLQLLRRTLLDWPIAFADQPAVNGAPRVSFIIGHRGEPRVAHLLKTIATVAAQRDVAVECIVVEQSERPWVHSLIPEWVRYIHTPIASNAEPYNRSRALNDGARVADGPLLVLHDNDFLVPSAYAAELARRHDEGNEFIDLKRFMFYLRAGDVGRVTDSTSIPPVSPERVVQNLLAGGSVAADRKAYFEIGCFDESFIGWGGEDNEFWDRATTRRVYSFAYLPFVHLWHQAQSGKVSAEAVGGRARYLELAGTPKEERIARLLRIGLQDDRNRPR
jgi:hypothetical protein